MSGKVGIFGITASGAIGSRENTGNFLHGYAARKILTEYCSVPMHEWSDEELDYIRAECTHLAFVAATTLSVNTVPPWTPRHEIYARNIERAGLPMVVFGLGAQAPLGQSVDDAVVDPRTVRLLSVLANHSTTIGVRGEFTAEICRKYRVSNVEVIGCQSCFLSLEPEYAAPPMVSNPEMARVVVNVTNYQNEWPLIMMATRERYGMIGQMNQFEFELKRRGYGPGDLIPEQLLKCAHIGLRRAVKRGELSFDDYAAYVREHFEQFYSVRPWLEHLSESYDFSFGTRLHGNMAALQAGVLALWAVHDSRTQEICDHLALPNLPVTVIDEISDVRELIQRTDYGPFVKRYPKAYRIFHDYLERQGVKHRLKSPVA